MVMSDHSQAERSGHPSRAGRGRLFWSTANPIASRPARICLPRDAAPGGFLHDGSVCREAATRFAVLGPRRATIRETLCACSPAPDEVSVLRIRSSMAVIAITCIAVVLYVGHP